MPTVLPLQEAISTVRNVDHAIEQHHVAACDVPRCHPPCAMQSEGIIRWHAGRYHAACAKPRAQAARI